MEPNTPTPTTNPTPTPEPNAPTPITNPAPAANAPAPPDQNTSTPTVPDPAPANLGASNPAKKPIWTSWQFYLMVILAVLCLAGWIFAVVELNNHLAVRDKISGLESEIAEKNKLLAKYGAELGYEVDQYGRPIVKPSDKNENNIQLASSDYIYISEWGIKLKIPEELKNVSYLFDSIITTETDPEAGEQTVSRQDLYIWGVPKAALSVPTPAFAQFKTNPYGLGLITRRPEKSTTDIKDGKKVYASDGYIYYYYYPQSVTSTDDQEKQWELTSVNLVKDMLSTGVSSISKTQKDE